MKIKKGDRLVVTDTRKGIYDAVATKDFDTVTDEWYSVKLDQREPVRGLTIDWHRGDSLPCRRGLATLKKRVKQTAARKKGAK